MVSSSPSPSTEVTEESSSGGSSKEGRWEVVEETEASSKDAGVVGASPSATETEEEGESPSPRGGSVEEEEETGADSGDPWEGSGGGWGGGRKEQGS
jgi:hypothetical protein